MTINLSIRNYSISIAGLDCTSAVLSFTGSDSKLDNGSGIVSFKGTLTLGKPKGSVFESLDDRVNDRWAMGNSLTIQVADDSGSLRLSPRGGTLRILDSAYDPKTRKLTIQVGDQLALLRVREPLANASKVCLGTNSSKTTVINNLLRAAGASDLFAGETVPGFISTPTAKLLEGSYIDQAAAIAASAGYFLWVDSADNVRASAINTANSVTNFVINGASIVQTERVAGEAPPCELKIKGKATVLKPANDRTHSEDQAFGPVALAGLKPKSTAAPQGEMIIRETTVDDDFKRGGKQRTIVTTTKEPIGIVFAGAKEYAGVTDLIVSSVTREVYYYEQYSPVMGNSSASACQQGNQGRLKRQTKEIYKPAGVVLRSVYDSYPKKLRVDKLVLIVAEQSETQYTYTQNVTTDDYSDGYAAEWQTILGVGPRITTLKYEPIGAISPDDFLYRAKDSVARPDTLTPSEYTIQFYKESSPGEWKKEIQVYKPICVSSPDAAKLIRSNSKGLTRAAIARLVTQLNQTEQNRTVSNSGQATPPAPDTYNAIFSVTEKTAQVVIKLPVNAAQAYRQGRKELTFEYVSTTGQGLAAKFSAESQCLALAKTWGALLWGRYKSVAYTTDLADQWWQYEPLTRIDVNEPENRFAYLGDGFSIAIAGKRCAVGFDGILLGQIVQTPRITPAVYTSGALLTPAVYENDVLVTPAVYSPPILVTPEVVELVDIVSPPYVQWRSLQAASGGAASMKRRGYTLEPITRSLQAASGGAIRDYSNVTKLRASSGGAAKGQHSTHTLKAASGNAGELVRSLPWSAITAARWRQMSDRQWRKIISLN